MASVPMDPSRRSRSGGITTDRPPVSAHPAFPAIVSLWFAALLGLGSLILPVQLLESMLNASGVASLIPSAAPPLGFTARAAIALAATTTGALLGVYAARKVTQASTRLPTAEREAYTDDAGDDFDDFADDGLDADLPPLRDPSPTLGRRRPLALAEEERPSDFLHVVPLPGDPAADEDDTLVLGQEYAPEASGIEVAQPVPQEYVPSAVRVEAAAPESPVEVSKSVPATAVEPLPFSPPSMARFGGSTPEPALADDEAEATMHEGDILPPEAPEPEPIPENDVEIVRHRQTFASSLQPAPADADGEVTGLVQLVQKLGQTLEKHREWTAQRAVATASGAASDSGAEPEAEAVTEIAHSRTEIAEEFEPAPADDAAEAMAAWFGKPAAFPQEVKDEPTSAVNPAPEPASSLSSAPAVEQGCAPFAGMGHLAAVEHGYEEDDEDDIEELAASFSLPLSASVGSQPQPAPARLRDASYVSLSADNPFRRPVDEFVRIEEPESKAGLVRPAVVFPHEETTRPATAGGPLTAARPFDRPSELCPPASPKVAQINPHAQPNPLSGRPASNDDSERALREALMNLQRMGK
ncbi:MAG: hypothetical protein JY451_05395 [Erythrobacter sp.]|nr:MAG: hypothetical protein JY451_05395 [Erythrobacter sp.]